MSGILVSMIDGVLAGAVYGLASEPGLQAGLKAGRRTKWCTYADIGAGGGRQRQQSQEGSVQVTAVQHL